MARQCFVETAATNFVLPKRSGKRCTPFGLAREDVAKRNQCIADVSLREEEEKKPPESPSSTKSLRYYVRLCVVKLIV